MAAQPSGDNTGPSFASLEYAAARNRERSAGCAFILGHSSLWLSEF